jgi:hypothetical protein
VRCRPIFPARGFEPTQLRPAPDAGSGEAFGDAHVALVGVVPTSDDGPGCEHTPGGEHLPPSRRLTM